MKPGAGVRAGPERSAASGRLAAAVSVAEPGGGPASRRLRPRLLALALGTGIGLALVEGALRLLPPVPVERNTAVPDALQPRWRIVPATLLPAPRETSRSTPPWAGPLPPDGMRSTKQIAFPGATRSMTATS